MTEAELDKLLQPYKDSNGNVKPKDVYRAILSCYTDKWQPIETAPEGKHVLLWFPNGEQGVGGMECGTLYFNDAHAPGGINIWTHGGPNAGSDWQLDEPPTDWMPLPEPPKKAGEE